MTRNGLVRSNVRRETVEYTQGTEDKWVHSGNDSKFQMSAGHYSVWTLERKVSWSLEAFVDGLRKEEEYIDDVNSLGNHPNGRYVGNGVGGRRPCKTEEYDLDGGHRVLGVEKMKED